MAQESPIIRLMQDAANKAAKSLMRDFGEVENLQVSKKGPGDFVSAADHRAEEILVNELQRVRPNYSFLLEESGEIKGSDDEFRWIIDPLDGTTNFLHGVPHFCTSVALEKRQANGKSEIVAAVINVPVLHEMYWAEKGQGAYVNNRRLLVSGRKQIGESLLASGGLNPHRRGSQATREAIQELYDKGAGISILGAAALELAYVAAGKLDGVWYIALNPWDIAAGILLVTEARGIVTPLGPSTDLLTNCDIVASNGHLHRDLEKIVSSFYTG